MLHIILFLLKLLFWKLLQKVAFLINFFIKSQSQEGTMESLKLHFYLVPNFLRLLKPFNQYLRWFFVINLTLFASLEEDAPRSMGLDPAEIFISATSLFLHPLHETSDHLEHFECRLFLVLCGGTKSFSCFFIRPSPIWLILWPNLTQIFGDTWPMDHFSFSASPFATSFYL